MKINKYKYLKYELSVLHKAETIQITGINLVY